MPLKVKRGLLCDWQGEVASRRDRSRRGHPAAKTEQTHRATDQHRGDVRIDLGKFRDSAESGSANRTRPEHVPQRMRLSGQRVRFQTL